MSYTKTTWVNGDTITAEKLNKIENGIESAGGVEPLIITISSGTSSTPYMMDKTYAEIKTAFLAGTPIIIQNGNKYGSITYIDDDEFEVRTGAYSGSLYADSSSGYPHMQVS